MAITKEDKQIIVNMLKKETGAKWIADEAGIHCRIGIKSKRKKKIQEFIHNIELSERVSEKTSYNKKRGLTYSVECTLNSALLELLTLAAPQSDVAAKKAQLEEDHRQIAAMLTKKTGYEWTSNENEVYCDAQIKAPNAVDATSQFHTMLQEHSLPIPELYGKTRGSEGNIHITARFTSATMLNTLLKGSVLAIEPPQPIEFVKKEGVPDNALPEITEVTPEQKLLEAGLEFAFQIMQLGARLQEKGTSEEQKLAPLLFQMGKEVYKAISTFQDSNQSKNNQKELIDGICQAVQTHRDQLEPLGIWGKIATFLNSFFETNYFEITREPIINPTHTEQFKEAKKALIKAKNEETPSDEHDSEHKNTFDM